MLSLESLRPGWAMMGLTLFIGRFVPTSRQVSILGFGYNRTNYQFDQGQRWGRFTAGLVGFWPTSKNATVVLQFG